MPPVALPLERPAPAVKLSRVVQEPGPNTALGANPNNNVGRGRVGPRTGLGARKAVRASHGSVGLEATRRVGLGLAKRAVGASLSNVGQETAPRAGLGANGTVGANLRMVRIGLRVDPGASHKIDQVVGASNVTRVIIITVRVLVSKMFVKALDMDTVDAARCWSRRSNIILTIIIMRVLGLWVCA